MKTILVVPQASPVCPNIKYETVNRVPDKFAPQIHPLLSPALVKYCAVMEPINNASDVYCNQILMYYRMAQAVLRRETSHNLRVISRCVRRES
jgi:hypothetical protein